MESTSIQHTYCVFTTIPLAIIRHTLQKLFSSVYINVTSCSVLHNRLSDRLVYIFTITITMTNMQSIRAPWVFFKRKFMYIRMQSWAK